MVDVCVKVLIYVAIDRFYSLNHRCDRFTQCSEVIVGCSKEVGDILVLIVRDAHQVASLRVNK